MLTINREKILGMGGYGIVYEGAWSEIKVAIKRIPLVYVTDDASSDREVNGLKKCDHENVIKLFHTEKDQDFRYFALELCDASLDQLFLNENDPNKYRGPMPPKYQVLLQLAKGLEHMHKMELVHRDIKPGNVLIWVNSTTKQVLMKWADFGYSKRVNERGTFSISGLKGTDNWFAPEIFNLMDEPSSSKNEEKKRGTVKSDVFAEGLVFGYFLMDGVHPFGDSNYQIETNVRTKGPVILPKTEEYRSLIQKMLEKEPEKRISSSDVVYQLLLIKSYSSEKLAFDREKVLGRGGYDTVYEGVWGEIKVAIKQIDKVDEASNEQEINLLKKCDHENVVRLFHVEEDHDFRYFAFELCEASLDKLFLEENNEKKYRGPMPSNEEVLLQLAKGLEHIHQMELVHCDIKPENVLIWTNPDKEKHKRVLMKWTGFSYSKSVKERESFSMSEVKESYNWIAPEILELMDKPSSTKNEETKKRTAKSDVFAEGLVFGYFLLDGVHPFGTSNVQIVTNLRTKEPVNLPETTEYRSLIQKMLEKEPEKRISSSDVVKELLLIKSISQKISNMFALFKRETPKLEEIEKLIQEGADINAKDENGLTPLLLLAQIEMKSDDMERIVSLLVKNGADVNSRDKIGRNALLILCEKHQNPNFFAIIKIFIENGLDINCKQINQRNALHLLCRFYQNENLIDIIRLLIKNGIEINCKEEDGWNALLILSHSYQNENLIDIIRLLIENGVDINYKNKDRWNALHILCRNYENKNLIDIIPLLIENKIVKMDVNSKINNGNNALHLLCRCYQNENLIGIIRIFIKNGIDLNCKGSDGSSAFHLLCAYYKNDNLIDIIRLLIENGIDVNCKMKDGWNILHTLCRNYQNENLIEIIRLLTEHKIHLNCKINDGNNDLTLLCRNYKNENLIDIIRLLIEKGSDVNFKMKDGWNILHILCRNYQNENLFDIIQILNENGIDINCKINNGNNALTLLCENYRNENLIDIIRLLIEKGIDINCKDNNGWNALLFLCREYRKEKFLIEIIRLLIEKKFVITSETFTYFKNNYKKGNREEVLQLLNIKNKEDEPTTKRTKYD